MKTVSIAARILTGLLFVVIGLNGFLFFLPAPASIPQSAMTFSGVMFTTHYMWMTMGFQILAGVLLLINRLVPFALIVLAAMLVNIITFHVTMWPQALLPMPIVALILWFLTAWPLRRQFAPLFAAKAPVP